jgi:hypothetical protein
VANSVNLNHKRNAPVHKNYFSLARIDLTVLSIFIRLTSGAVVLTSRRPLWIRTIPSMTSSATTSGTRTDLLTRSFPPASLSSSPSVHSNLLVADGNPLVVLSNIRASFHFVQSSCSFENYFGAKQLWTGSQSTNRVATAAFWHTFYHDGKIVPGAGKDRGARQPPFTTFTITYKVAVLAPAEWAETLTLSHLYQYMNSMDRVPNLILKNLLRI